VSRKFWRHDYDDVPNSGIMTISTVYPNCWSLHESGSRRRKSQGVGLKTGLKNTVILSEAKNLWFAFMALQSECIQGATLKRCVFGGAETHQ
jgi:hypothetical protein